VDQKYGNTTSAIVNNKIVAFAISLIMGQIFAETLLQQRSAFVAG